ncbi:MAG: DUF2155 domain-containing protein [Alphaproteobacteria bacterium]
MMRVGAARAFSLFLAMAGAAYGQETPVTDAADVTPNDPISQIIQQADTAKPATKPAPVVTGGRAKVRVLTFASNEVDDVTLKADVPQTVGDLTLTLRACRANFGRVLGQDVAWLEVEGPAATATANAAAEQEKTAKVTLFKGWMYNTFTDISTLDYPQADVRLLGCTHGAAKAEVKAEAAVPEVSSTTESATDEAGE